MAAVVQFRPDHIKQRHAVCVVVSKRRRAKLTEPLLERMTAGERIYDSALGGFYAQRGKRGITFRVIADLPTKVFRTKLSGSQSIEKAIGKFPDMSAKAARAEAQRVIGQIKAGVDPREPLRGPDGPTLQAAWDDYKTDYLVKKEGSPATTRHYEYCFKRLTKWHGKPLVLIARSPQALKEEHARLTEQNGKIAANVTLQFLGILYRHVVGSYPTWPEWPRRAYINHKHHSRADKGMSAKDLREWWSQVSELRDDVLKEVLLFTLLSGLRKNDVLTARWSNVDEEARTLHLPCPKGGASRAFNLPLSQPMLDCIRRVRDEWRKAGHRDSAFLFPSATSQSGAVNDMRAGDIKTGHILRYTFSNMAKAAGVWESDVSVLMNHRGKTQTAGYHNPNATPEYYLTQMEKISTKIMGAIGL
jgi:hypothetical protein